MRERKRDFKQFLGKLLEKDWNTVHRFLLCNQANGNSSIFLWSMLRC